MMLSAFQSSFELTGYITCSYRRRDLHIKKVSKLFRAYGLYNNMDSIILTTDNVDVSKLFRAYGLYNALENSSYSRVVIKFQSSFELTGYITNPDECLQG